MSESVNDSGRAFGLRLHIGDVSERESCEECGVDPADVEDHEDEYVGPFDSTDSATAWAEHWANEMREELDETQLWSWTILPMKSPAVKCAGDCDEGHGMCDECVAAGRCPLQHSDDGPRKCPRCERPAAEGGVEGSGSVR